ncbi:Vacuolar calcium ion transporter [Leucoagaricus sp. SymC.cos]|nr:Vacuolar calcium ion transporter [Leucoagaricus sp. SymC.cos]
MAFYCGKDLGDLIVITLNNTVEATLAIILLIRKELRILQSTIIGVIILHLLLIPGTSFITGGANIMSQDLTPHITELNHTLLTMGVLSLVLPAAFFAALDRGVNVGGGATEEASVLLTDEMRDHFLRFSRGMAIIMLIMYICSRIYLHDPPGDDNALQPHAELPDAIREHEEKLASEDPEVNQWICIVVIVIAVAFMAVTAEFVCRKPTTAFFSLTHVWFGLILLPIISFAADGAIAVLYFLRSLYHHFFHTPMEPITLAKARAIDLSIQFSLFWMPVFVLLAWWTHRPLSLLFDLFEVAILVGACFLVNYVTADAKTNWAEGCAMVAFYAMIALTAWYYPGQPEVETFLSLGSLAVETVVTGGVEGAAAAATGSGH